MKKLIVYFATALLFLTLAPSAFAATDLECAAQGLIPGTDAYTACVKPAATGQVKVETCPPGPFSSLCKLSTADFGETVGKVINFVFVIATVVALFYLIYGGLKWIMSEGDKSAVETARNHIVSAIIGLIVIFLAYFIINIVLGFFTGVGLQDLTLPRLPK